MRRGSTIRRLKASSGFTLIEVMITTVVLSIAFLATFASVMAVINGNDFSKRMAVATMLAQDKLEELKNLSYTDSNLSAGDHPASSETLTLTGGGSYTRRWNVAVDTPATGMKTMTITVQWRSGGASRSMVATAIRAE